LRKARRMAIAYCIFEGNDKNVFVKKMKKNNFYKNITFCEDDVYRSNIEESNDIISIDYTDYDYFGDLF
jgi:hypothetical protein